MLEKLKQLIEPVQSITAGEAGELLSDKREGTFTLLDVRQPKEYEQGHIPGSMLIPIPELSDSLDRLDKDKPVVVY
jgi:rhodanese-related sulfurtransferase